MVASALALPEPDFQSDTPVHTPDWSDIVNGFHMGDEPSRSIDALRSAYCALQDELNVARVRVVDLGCLDGRNTDPLIHSLALDVHGVDIPSPQFEAFQCVTDDMNLPLTLHEIQKGGPLPFEDNSVHAIQILRVLHILTDPVERMEFLSECWRKLVPGGILAIAVRSRAAIDDIDEGGFLRTEIYRSSGNVLAQRDSGDIERVYYDGLDGLMHDFGCFQMHEAAQHGQLVNGSLMPGLCMTLDDELEIRHLDDSSGPRTYWAPCLQIALRRHPDRDLLRRSSPVLLPTGAALGHRPFLQRRLPDWGPGISPPAIIGEFPHPPGVGASLSAQI